jgi:hypothetical protein
MGHSETLVGTATGDRLLLGCLKYVLRLTWTPHLCGYLHLYPNFVFVLVFVVVVVVIIAVDVVVALILLLLLLLLVVVTGLFLRTLMSN